MTDDLNTNPEPTDSADEFQTLGDEPEPTLIQEFWQFLCENKKWWLLPILIVFGLMGLVIVLNSTGAVPFIYALF